MAEIGRINKLKIKRIRDYGAQLDGGESGDILLPKSNVPKQSQPGDELEVFVFLEAKGRLRASIKQPRATVGQFVSLQVVAKSFSGAFLDWGMPKDLLVPKKEQLTRMEEGKSYTVFIYLDEETGRVSASAKLDKFFSPQPPDYKEGEEVDLIIYDQTDLGYKVVVNNAHGGMVYKNEVFQKVFIGQQLKGYIKKIREDLKIDLSLQKPGYKGVDDISQTILKIIKKHGNKLALSDKTPPEEIYRLFGVSKKVYKKAIGALYKKKLVTIDSNGVRLAQAMRKK